MINHKYLFSSDFRYRLIIGKINNIQEINNSLNEESYIIEGLCEIITSQNKNVSREIINNYLKYLNMCMNNAK